MTFFAAPLVLLPTLCLVLISTSSTLAWQQRQMSSQDATASNDGSGGALLPPLVQFIEGSFNFFDTKQSAGRPVLIDGRTAYAILGRTVQAMGLQSIQNHQPIKIWSYAREETREIGTLLLGRHLFVHEQARYPGTAASKIELVALGRTQGEEVWRKASTAGPIAVSPDSLFHYESFSFSFVQKSELVTLNSDTGQERWRAFTGYPVRIVAGANRVMVLHREDSRKTLTIFSALSGQKLAEFSDFPPSLSQTIGLGELQMMLTKTMIIVLDAEQVLAFGLNGSLLWTRRYMPAGQSSTAYGCATDGAMVWMGVTARAMGENPAANFSAAFSAATGDELWRAAASFTDGWVADSGYLSSLISANGVVYSLEHDQFPPAEWIPVIRARAGSTGELLQEIRPAASRQIFELFTAGGMLYANGAIHAPFPLPSFGVVFAFERTPADLSVHVTGPACTVTGTPIPFDFLIRNSGPGEPEDVDLEIRFSPTAAIVSIGIERAAIRDYSPGFLRLTLGQMKALEARTGQITFQAAEPGTLTVAALITTRSRLRDPQPDDNQSDFSTLVGRRPAGAIDLVATGLEVTQGIQNRANGVTLIAGKKTLARFYAESPAGSVENVRALLHGTTKTGTILPGSPLEPIADCMEVRQNGPARSAADQTFNFYLPEPWLSGEIRLRAEVNPGALLPEVSHSNNSVEQSISFVGLPPICIRCYPVRTADDAGKDLYGEEDSVTPEIRARALTHLPVAEMRYYFEDAVLEEYEIFGFGPYELDVDGDDDSLGILHTLWWHDQFSDDPDECDDLDARTHHLGVVHANTAGRFGGYASGVIQDIMPVTPTDQLIVKMNPSYLGGEGPFGGITLAHELGHNYGRFHVDCGDPFGTSSMYPFEPCHIGPNNEMAFYGTDMMDPARIQIIAPTEAADLMSYGPRRWTSSHTWAALASKLCQQRHGGCLWVTTASTLPAPRPMLERAPEEFLLVTGWITPAEIQVQAAYTISQRQPLMPQAKANKIWSSQKQAIATKAEQAFLGEWLDDAGQVLHTERLNLIDVADAAHGQPLFSVAMPLRPDATTLRLRAPGRPSWIKDLSATAPTVEVTTPSEGAEITDHLTVEWTAEDEDGDPLLATVQYSPDGGASWQVLGANLQTQKMELPVRNLPGSDGLAKVRVIVTDGFHTATAEAGPFSVAKRSPRARIESPAEGAIFAPGAFIVLRGSAYDPEDGPLTGGALRWNSSSLGQIGTGEEIIFPKTGSGRYRIELVARDSDGNSTTASRTIVIASALPEYTVWPVTHAAAEGDSLRLSLVIPAGAEVDSQQWFRNGIAIPGATGPELLIEPLTAAHAGEYSAILEVAGQLITARGGQVEVRSGFRFTAYGLLGDGRLQMTIEAAAHQAYAIERSADLRAWTPIQTGTGPGSFVINPADERSFYRARAQ
jgi:outer membrane protein assembly factor BamB